MKFEIVIDNYDNAEMFELDQFGKLLVSTRLAARELRRLDSWIENGVDGFNTPILDTNGNTIGHMSWEV